MDYTAADATWVARRRSAVVLRVALALAPVAGSLMVALLFARFLAPARLGLPWWAWGVIVAVASTAVLMVVDNLSRRLLPLVSLLRMTLIFPDQAPSRYRVARRSFSTRQLQRRIEEATTGGVSLGQDGDPPTATGEKLLELVAALSLHDPLTRGHCERVRAYTDLIAEQLDVPEDDANRLRWAALLHDVGKLTVPSEILTKAGRPTDDEFEILMTHAAEGQRMCAPLTPWLGDWLDVVGQHHERWDGDGYPAGLAGSDIHLGARIVAVADTYDVITAARSYKKPISAEAARAEITRCAGSQFDPDVVRAFLSVSLGRLRVEGGLLAWFVALPFIPSAAVARLALLGALAVGSTGAGLTQLPDGAPEDLAFDDPTSDPWGEPSTAADGPDDDRDDDPLTRDPNPTDSEPPFDGDDPGEIDDPDEPGGGTDSSPTGPDDVPTDDSLPSTETTTEPGLPPTTDPGETGSGGTTTSTSSGGGSTTTTTTSGGGSTSTTSSGGGSTTTTTTSGGGSTSTTSSGGGSTTTTTNSAPTAMSDTAQTDEDATVFIATSAVLANDEDPDSDPITVVGVEALTGGVPSLEGSLIRFVPTADHNGSGQFRYTITDGSESATAVVTVTIQPVPDPPTAVDDAYSTGTGLALTVNAPGLLANDSDPDGESVSVVPDLLSQPSNGVVVTGADGSFVYFPSPLFTGVDTFVYEITDTTERTDSATVRIAVG